MVRVRDDYSASELRRLAKAARTTTAPRRVLSLALLLEGTKRAEAVLAGGMDRQTLRDWVHRFNSEGPEGLYSKPGLGPSCRLSEAQQQEPVAIIEAGPDLAEHGVVRFRLRDLCATRASAKMVNRQAAWYYLEIWLELGMIGMLFCGPCDPGNPPARGQR